jgi:hypothetical protein
VNIQQIGLEVCKAQGLTPNSSNFFYTNLQALYSHHNYVANQVCNLGETNIQANKQAKPRVLARRRSNTIYSTIPKYLK